MSKIGTADIKGIMLGSTEIVKAYLGSSIVYQNVIPAPEGYEWATYIKSTSNAWINTGISSNNILTIECEMCVDALDGFSHFFGANTVINLSILSNGRIILYRNGSAVMDWNSNKYNSKMKIKFTKGTATVGATKKNINNANITATDILCILQRNTSNSGNYKTRGTIWWFKMYDNNNNLIRDYVPIKRLSDNKYGLWDRVSESFFLSPNNVAFAGE